MRRLLYANLVTRTPASRDGQTLDFPAFVAGEQQTFALRFLDDVAGSLVQTTLDVVSIRAAVGRRDAAPARGTFALKIGSGSSTSANTTPDLQFDASPQSVATALNALSGGTEDYAVTMDGPDYLIRRTGGGTFTIAGEDNNLEPSSFVRVRTFTRDGAQIHRIRLVQAPVAFTDSFDLIVPTAPSIALVRDGGADSSDTFFWNEIQALTVPADFRGTYQLKRGYARTRLLDSTDGPAEIAEALNAILAPEGGSVAVTNPQSQVANIEFQGDLAGTDVGLLEVAVFNAPAGDPTFVLNFNTQEVFRELSAAEAVPLVFEVEVTARSVPGDEESDTRVIKLWSAPVVLARPVNWEGLAAAQNIDWLRPPGPRNYIPFTTDQVLTGQQQAFTAPLGDGSATSFTIDHNLGSAVLSVKITDAVTTRVLTDDEYEVFLDSDDSLSITFDTAPGINALDLAIIAIGPESVFQAHTHTMEQITGLEALLEDLGERLETVESAIAIPGAGAASTPSWSSSIILPPFGEIFPAAPIRNGKPTQPPLPRAIRDTTTTAIAGAELPAATSVGGSVYKWDATTEVYLPGDSFRRGRLIKKADAPAVMSDGFHWWLAEEGPADIFYPTEMTRVLWEIVVSPEQLAPGRRLRLNWSFLLALVADRPELRGTYRLRVRKGVPTAESALGSAPNIEGITWDAASGSEVPLFEQTITLTRAGMIHEFAAEIVRASGGSLTASKTIYGKTTSTDAPSATNFILRAELSRFDITNYSEATGLPVGQVFLLNGDATDEAAGRIKERFSIQTSDAAPSLGLSAIIS